MKTTRVAILAGFPLSALSGGPVGHGGEYDCLGKPGGDHPPHYGSNHTLILVEEI
ncbi:MAG: hypothetical protein H7Y36_01210 [Armatimonadetes bacterium]|nr:hypothetical protein [Akkermansiaceae bacterium]